MSDTEEKYPRLFVSLPMNGFSEYEIREQMNAIHKKVEYFDGPHELINTINTEEPPFDDPDRIGVWYLGNSIQLLSEADLVVFATAWHYARGCRIEHRVCEEYNIPFKYEFEYDDMNRFDPNKYRS